MTFKSLRSKNQPKTAFLSFFFFSSPPLPLVCASHRACLLRWTSCWATWSRCGLTAWTTSLSLRGGSCHRWPCFPSYHLTTGATHSRVQHTSIRTCHLQAGYSTCGPHWSLFFSPPDPLLCYEGFAFVSSCVYAAGQPSNLAFTHAVLKLQARSGSGSQSLESNHQRVAGPDRIRSDTPLCAWQRIFNMMPASICCHGYQFEIILRAQLQTCRMMHFPWPLLVYKGFFLTDSQLICFSTRVSEQVFPYL